MISTIPTATPPSARPNPEETSTSADRTSTERKTATSGLLGPDRTKVAARATRPAPARTGAAQTELLDRWADVMHQVRDRGRTVSLRSRLTVRVFDMVVSLGALVVLSPAIIVLVALVALTSPGPVVYTHWRVGLRGGLFPCLKFRSMYADADARLQEVLDTDPEARRQWEADHKIQNDPRVTPLGRFIRKTNLDELPQLLNVLWGHMSIVGPRPIVPEEARRFGHSLPTVLSVKPGMAGLWQISGRNDVSYDERVAFEVAYASHRTLRRDVVICFKTARQMLRPGSNGAY